MWRRTLALLLLCVAIEARPRFHFRQFLATAYSIEGTTKSGEPAQPGVVAADTSVLPIGTKIQVLNAGPHSGVYTVLDTGRKVRGQHIDIFMPLERRAREFGRKIVHVRVLKWGEPTKQ